MQPLPPPPGNGTQPPSVHASEEHLIERSASPQDTKTEGSAPIPNESPVQQEVNLPIPLKFLDKLCNPVTPEENDYILNSLRKYFFIHVHPSTFRANGPCARMYAHYKGHYQFDRKNPRSGIEKTFTYEFSGAFISDSKQEVFNQLRETLRQLTAVESLKVHDYVSQKVESVIREKYSPLFWELYALTNCPTPEDFDRKTSHIIKLIEQFKQNSDLRNFLESDFSVLKNVISVLNDKELDQQVQQLHQVLDISAEETDLFFRKEAFIFNYDHFKNPLSLYFFLESNLLTSSPMDAMVEAAISSLYEDFEDQFKEETPLGLNYLSTCVLMGFYRAVVPSLIKKGFLDAADLWRNSSTIRKKIIREPQVPELTDFDRVVIHAYDPSFTFKQFIINIMSEVDTLSDEALLARVGNFTEDSYRRLLNIFRVKP
jgi:hypothetical protein